MSLTVKDYEELQSKANKILQDLESVDKIEWKKKRDLIQEYVITNRTLLEAQKLPIENRKDFCSYIKLTLINRGVTVNDNGTFYALFADDEKQENMSRIADAKSPNISSDLQTAEEKLKHTREVIVDKYTDYLEYASVSVQQCKELIDDIMNKYPD